jgi:hypothetical protein
MKQSNREYDEGKKKKEINHNSSSHRFSEAIAATIMISARGTQAEL